MRMFGYSYSKIFHSTLRLKLSRLRSDLVSNEENTLLKDLFLKSFFPWIPDFPRIPIFLELRSSPKSSEDIWLVL